MNTNSLKTNLRSAIAWTRRQPRALLIPGALLAVIIALVAIAAMHSHGDASAPQIVADGTPALQPAAQPLAPQAPTRAASAVDAVQIPTAPMPASTASITAPVAAAVLTPPGGLQSGFVSVAREQQDQFGKWVRVSQTTAAAQSTTLTTRSGASNATRTVWSAWTNLSANATIVELDVGGAGGGEVTGSVDGASLGPVVTHFAGGSGKQQIASLPLAAGWHQVKVTVTQRARAQPLAARVSFGNGTTAPTPTTPWSTTQAAPPAASAEPQNTKPAPAAASTTASQGAAQ